MHTSYFGFGPDTSQQIARDAITILINLSTDRDVLDYLASDKEFVSVLLDKVTVCQFPLSAQHAIC